MPTHKRASTPALKNTHSESPHVFADIQKTLVAHKAKGVTFEFDDGRTVGISFWLEVKGRTLSFRMPARIGNVERIFRSRKGRPLTDREKVQAYQTAWANIRDWLSAQFALIETEMVAEEEIFLPYLLNDHGQTLYEVMEERQFLLEGPRDEH